MGAAYVMPLWDRQVIASLPQKKREGRASALASMALERH